MTPSVSLLLLALAPGAVEAELRTVEIRVCQLELTEAGRRARFSFNYLYKVRTGGGGEVVAVERLTELDHPPFVREETFEPCLRSWRLGPSSEYGVTISVGTTAAENAITVRRAGELNLRLLVPE